MTDFVTVKLELVRPGPAHNQLLSPLTPYMALCGEGSPITFHIDLEHHQMLSRLERLRYVTRQGAAVAGVPENVREAALLEVGDDVKRVLGEIRTLLAEIARARESHPERDDGIGRAVHLRVVLGGSELALIPFEMAFAPQAFPGEGLQFCLQLALPVVPTRETRSSRQLPVAWDRKIEPKVLLVAAAPDGLTVPLESHVHALRAAVEPWVEWPKGIAPAGSAAMEHARLEFVKKRLRVIVDASVDDIQDRCTREQFTHVHILAHGDTYEAAGEQRFGLALCKSGDRTRKDVVSGSRLATALQSASLHGAWRSSPLIVTLATCDSGNQRSVLVPGGSIAHDLHVAGIPWVIASQFPLTIPGSVRLTEALYPLLLRGDDPRQALYDVRRRLHMCAERDHDWAALVAYATVPDNFDDQIYNFFERQVDRVIKVSLGRADELATATDRDEHREADLDQQLRRAEDSLALWQARLPKGDGEQDRARRAECYGIHGSVFKRIALMRQARGEATVAVKAELNKALAHYRRAMDEWASSGDKHHWVATQALSLGAVLGDKPDEPTFTLARELARRDLSRAQADTQAWAHGTMAELEMLSIYHAHAAPEASAAARDSVVRHCQAIVELMGPKSFPVESTRRQFKRYVDMWQDPRWTAIAQAAVDALTPPA